MRRRIRSESEVVLLGSIAQLVKDDSGLDSGQSLFRIEPQQPIVILGHVHDNRHIAALARNRGAPTASQHRCIEFPTRSDGRDYVVLGTRNYDADWNLPVVRSIRGVYCPRPRIESDFPADGPLQLFFKPAQMDGRLVPATNCRARGGYLRLQCS